MPPILAEMPVWVSDHLTLLIGVAVMVVALAGFGLTDLRRFSGGRVWAISGVCFAESIRRKVLWLLPLAIVGLVAVVQLQQPADEQDAIRQTTKFCLMASGLVVVLTTLILACTNLPREIESRVIFTVVTKPTTRLEIILGKIVGFARVSFTILLVMGLFTWGYLHLRSYALGRELRQRLDLPAGTLGAIDPIARPTSTHYVEAGLLNAKTLADPSEMNIYGRPPVAGSPRRYLDPEGYLLVPFVLPSNLKAFEPGEPTGMGLQLHLYVGYDPAPPKPPVPGPIVPAAAAAAGEAKPPMLTVQFFDPNADALVGPELVTPTGQKRLPSPDGTKPLVIDVPASAVALLDRVPWCFLALSRGDGEQPLWVEDTPDRRIAEIAAPLSGTPTKYGVIPPTNPFDDKPGRLLFEGRQGTFGQQVKGDPTGTGQACVYRFRGVNVGRAAAGSADGHSVPIELRVGIEKANENGVEDVLTDLRLSVTDVDTGRQTDLPQSFHPENNRTMYGSIPADACGGHGNFDLTLRCFTPDQWVGVKPTSLSLVVADGSFGLNLVKSLSILWLLSLLVTTISVFCSTFLTWPTAVVLTVVLLFGRWGLNELGDAASAGLGRSFVTDFGVQDPATAQTLTSSVDGLTRAFRAVATVLPDVSAFSATDDIDRGLTVPYAVVGDAVGTVLAFGLPLAALAFIRLKYMEVAP